MTAPIRSMPEGLEELIRAIEAFGGTIQEAHGLVTVVFCVRAGRDLDEFERAHRVGECAKRLGVACAMFAETPAPDSPPDQSPPSAGAMPLPVEERYA